VVIERAAASLVAHRESATQRRDPPELERHLSDVVVYRTMLAVQIAPLTRAA
jgi:hypothetical protein